jgi:hypothetical protein
MDYVRCLTEGVCGWVRTGTVEFAKSLENVLHRLVADAEVGAAPSEDLVRRFDALRGSALLPTSRENRAARLTQDHVVNAVLSLVALQPSGAAVGCAVLARFQPIGGPDAEALPLHKPPASHVPQTPIVGP